MWNEAMTEADRSSRLVQQFADPLIESFWRLLRQALLDEDRAERAVVLFLKVRLVGELLASELRHGLLFVVEGADDGLHLRLDRR